MIAGVKGAADANGKIDQFAAYVIAGGVEADSFFQDQEARCICKGDFANSANSLRMRPVTTEGVGVVPVEAQVAPVVAGGLAHSLGRRGGVAGFCRFIRFFLGLLALMEKHAGVALQLVGVEKMDANADDADGDQDDGNSTEPKDSMHGGNRVGVYGHWYAARREVADGLIS